MEISNKLRPLGWHVGAILVAATISASPALAQVAFQPQPGWWFNPNEPAGRGVILEVNNQGEMFASAMVFDNDGRSEWFVVETSAATDGNQAGLLQKFVGGQTTGGEYRQGQFVGFAGIAYFNFDSPTSGAVSWPGGHMDIKRYDIIAGGVAAGPAAGAPRPGWWWNAGENGRGYFIEVQGDNMYFSGLMYNDLGEPTWYYSRGSMVNPTFYTGKLFEPYGGQTMEGSFQQASQNYDRGNFSILFSSDTQAMLTLPNGRQIAIQRYGF